MDFSTVKAIAIPEGIVKKITSGGAKLWEMPAAYTNLVPLSVDTDGSIFNGTGYKDNVRLSSSGGISSSAQNGSTTTGFIPWHGDADILRIKGVEWLGLAVTDGHHYFNFYDANKKFLDYIASYNVPDYAHILTATRDSNGVETFIFNQDYGTTNTFLQNVRKASYIRITARGKGENMIVTINEEIA